MKRFFAIFVLLILTTYTAIADSWSITIPSENGDFAVLNAVIENGKFYIIGTEVDHVINGYEFTETNGCYIISMEDGNHKAMRAGDDLFYELVPGGVTVLLNHVDPYEPRLSTDDDSFNIAELAKIAEEDQEKEDDVHSDTSPVGMWSFYWDARQLNKALGNNAMNFDIKSNSLFLLDSGAAYLQQATVKDGKEEFYPELLSGMWIGNAEDLTIKIDDMTFKAWIDNSDRLFFKMTDSMASIFNRVTPYDYKEGFLK